MIIKKKEQKQQVYNAFRAFLMVNGGYNLKSFCLKFGYNYSTVYQQMARKEYYLQLDVVNSMIRKIDSKQSVQLINGNYMIGRTL